MCKERQTPAQKWKANTARKVPCLKKTHKNWSGLVVRTAIVKFSEKKLFLNF